MTRLLIAAGVAVWAALVVLAVALARAAALSDRQRDAAARASATLVDLQTARTWKDRHDLVVAEADAWRLNAEALEAELEEATELLDRERRAHDRERNDLRDRLNFAQTRLERIERAGRPIPTGSLVITGDPDARLVDAEPGLVIRLGDGADR